MDSHEQKRKSFGPISREHHARWQQGRGAESP